MSFPFLWGQKLEVGGLRAVFAKPHLEPLSASAFSAVLRAFMMMCQLS